MVYMDSMVLLGNAADSFFDGTNGIFYGCSDGGVAGLQPDLLQQLSYFQFQCRGRLLNRTHASLCFSCCRCDGRGWAAEAFSFA
ncbi:hypothetical protein ACLOJK_005810 [Asimina triloba]